MTYLSFSPWLAEPLFNRSACRTENFRPSFVSAPGAPDRLHQIDPLTDKPKKSQLDCVMRFHGEGSSKPLTSSASRLLRKYQLQPLILMPHSSILRPTSLLHGDVSFDRGYSAVVALKPPPSLGTRHTFPRYWRISEQVSLLLPPLPQHIKQLT